MEAGAQDLQMAIQQILTNLKGLNLENLKATKAKFCPEEQGHSLMLTSIWSVRVMKIFSLKDGSNNREFIQVVSCSVTKCFSSCDLQFILEVHFRQTLNHIELFV